MSTDTDGESLLIVIQKLTDLTEEIAMMKTLLASQDAETRSKVDELQRQVGKQGELISRQQRYLGYTDRKERPCSIVVMGVPEDESLDGATMNPDKISKVWRAAGIENDFLCGRQLEKNNKDEAEQRGTRRWPILLRVQARDVWDKILEKAKTPKEMGIMYSTIYVKKNSHPSLSNCGR